MKSSWPETRFQLGSGVSPDTNAKVRLACLTSGQYITMPGQRPCFIRWEGRLRLPGRIPADRLSSRSRTARGRDRRRLNIAVRLRVNKIELWVCNLQLVGDVID